MKIERIELREISLRLKEPFEISSGISETRRIILVRLMTDGVSGWAECVASETPSYSYETTETAWHVLTDFLIPAIVGSDPVDARDLLAPTAWVRGHRMARASLEMAGWDLEAKTRGISLQALLADRLGEALRERVPVGVSVGLQRSNEALAERVEGFVAEGYRKVKIKIKPGRDVEMLSFLRARFPDTPFMADANSAYTLADTDHLAALDDLDLMMIEQPLRHDDLLHHAQLQTRLRTPICLDESIRSLRDVETALRLGSGRIINIKPGRVGGFAESLAIHDYCRARDVPVWCGGMLESGVGRAFNVALASLPGFSLPGDISASARYWERDVVSPEFTIQDGHMAVPTGPGIGVELDLVRIEAITTRSRVFDA